jgi:hypothetical protein
MTEDKDRRQTGWPTRRARICNNMQVRPGLVGVEPRTLRRGEEVEGVPILLSVGYSACHWCHVHGLTPGNR